MARYALVIGIARYSNSFSKDLPKAATDAEAIAQLLEQHHYNVTRLPRKRIAENQYIVDETARLTGAKLSQELKTFLRDRAVKQDTLIYFAGHGFRVMNSITDEQEGYLATSDCTKDGQNAIRFDDLNTLIRKADLSSLVILLDCCYAGALLEEQRNLLQSTQTTISQKQNYCLIAACRDFERAREGEKHGIFTSAVLKGLSADHAVNEEITSNDLFGFVSRELATSGWVKMVCLNLTRTGGEEKDTRQRQPKQELLRLAADSQNQLVLNTVLTMLVDERQLVTGKEDSGEAWVDLAHEALMEGWERFAKWRKEDRELRRLRDRVEDERRDWQEHEQNDDYLISGGLLVQVTKRWTELKPYLHVTAQEFYQLSYERDREKTSYAAGVSHFKERLQELQGKLSERLEEMERLRLARESSKASNLPSEPSEASRAIAESSSLEDVDESRYIKLSEEIRDFLWRAQGYEQRMYFSHVAADWLSSNQETLVELIVQYSLSKNPQLTSDGEPADSPEQVSMEKLIDI
jgi:uncharacterized caspase-like protein